MIYSDIPYEACIQKAQIEILKTRRERLIKQFFLQICQPNHRLHYLLNKRDSIIQFNSCFYFRQKSILYRLYKL